MNGEVRAAVAARELGVSAHLVEGLVQSRRIPGRVERGKSGRLVCFVNKAALVSYHQMMTTELHDAAGFCEGDYHRSMPDGSRCRCGKLVAPR